MSEGGRGGVNYNSIHRWYQQCSGCGCILIYFEVVNFHTIMMYTYVHVHTCTWTCVSALVPRRGCILY